MFMLKNDIQEHFEHMRTNALTDHYNKIASDKELTDRLTKLREMETQIIAIITASANLSTLRE